MWSYSLCYFTNNIKLDLFKVRENLKTENFSTTLLKIKCKWYKLFIIREIILLKDPSEVRNK